MYEQHTYQKQLEMVTHRFFDVFAWHNISVMDIPKFFPQIQRSELMDFAKLVDCLHDDVLQVVADSFAIDMNWLRGDSNHVYSFREKGWYKSPNVFIDRLQNIRQQSTNVNVSFIVGKHDAFNSLSCSRNKESSEDQSVFVQPIIEYRTSVNGISFITYDVFEAQTWNYERSRHYLKLLMIACDKLHIHYDGVQVSDAFASELRKGLVAAASKTPGESLVFGIERFIEDSSANPEQDELYKVHDLYNSNKLKTSDLVVH